MIDFIKREKPIPLDVWLDELSKALMTAVLAGESHVVLTADLAQKAAKAATEYAEALRSQN